MGQRQVVHDLKVINVEGKEPGYPVIVHWLDHFKSPDYYELSRVVWCFVQKVYIEFSDFPLFTTDAKCLKSFSLQISIVPPVL